MLRQEVFALDGGDCEDQPYSVTEQNFTIRRIQPTGENRHAVFLKHPRESIIYHYERNADDPRVSHSLTLEVDLYGNVLKSAAVGYGRRDVDAALDDHDQAKQSDTKITYTENEFTNAIDTEQAYRTHQHAATRVYELTGYIPSGRSSRCRNVRPSSCTSLGSAMATIVSAGR